MSKYRTIAALALAFTTAGTVAHAAGMDPNDALAISDAKVSLSQAIATAENEVNGKATHAAYEPTYQGGLYDVEVANGNKVFDMKVDAQDGKVVGSRIDTMDQDGIDPMDRDERSSHERNRLGSMGDDHGLGHEPPGDRDGRGDHD